MKFHAALLAVLAATPNPAAANFVLRHGQPSSVGMLAKPLKDMVQNITEYSKPRNYGDASHNEVRAVEPGSANIVARHGVIVSAFATGKRNLYADANGTLLDPADQEDATLDTVYDLASISKLFTAVAVLREVDTGRVKLEENVATYLPEFAANGKGNIKVIDLLTHTSGLMPLPVPDLWKSYYSSIDERVHKLLTLAPQEPRRTMFLYSDIGFMTLRYLLERVTGLNHELLVYSYTIPLGMRSTFFNRGNLEGPLNPFHNRTAPTEFEIEAQGPEEPKRPQPVRGTVHDENTWALGGVSGHAGVFSTVGDVAIFCQMILNNGIYNGHRVLSKKAVDLIFTDFNAQFPGNNYGAGFALNQTYTQGSMQSMKTASHAGFTGTTLAIDRPSGTFWLHFANRVHPSRHWATNNPARRAMGYWVAKSLGRNVPWPN
ncbi:hypothetical protein MRS44_005167 [Fusarium solani]|jgi:CubicO group peptidase (beta-lactamase class C family)|uniref:uncharacterized protein n=1 Tax=Fusarium solani TaxID=169388 RepID=UPI0023285709|nr:hypothetical protein MRS44_005167 [Fusarium solani]KAJ4234570.1 hypothetical protein NW759_001565 [Fusarium solani]